MIDERNRRRLVVILQHAGSVLHPVHERQFNAMTLKLDGEPHLAARIPAGNVVATASNTTGGVTRPDFQYGCLRRFGQREPLAPAQEVSLAEHPAPLRRVRGRGGYFRFRRLRSFFSANVYLWPASAMSF